VGILGVVVSAKLGNVALHWGEVWRSLGRSLFLYYGEFFALFVGFELGAMSHSLSDWTNSAYKRYQKQGIQGLLPDGKIKKRKPTQGVKAVKKRRDTQK
jgi:uncharacterized metal-binding protein